jgi:dihydroorotate dehydrogenase electron transfer subunit
MVRACDDYERLLRRPLSVHRVNDRGEIALLYEVIGRGTHWLSQREAGETVDVLGPLGNGFRVDTKSLLLVAGGCGVAPLVFVAERATGEGRHVKLLLGARNADLLYPAHLLPKSLNPTVITEDGSSGRRGLSTDLLADFKESSADENVQILACGPLDMYKEMLKIDWLKGKSVQVSLESRMGCGFGACFGCTIETKRGLKRVCKDGPVFELSDLLI